MLQQHFQNILSWLCTSVEHLGSNATDEVYKLTDIKEAHMAFDVFNALGFGVKIYDDETSSRLYITKPRFDKDTLERKLESARAYSVTLKQIQQSLQNLRTTQKEICDYSVNLVNSPDNSVKINLTAYKEVSARSASKVTTQEAPAFSPASPPPMPTGRKGKKHKDPFLHSGLTGTALAKTHLMQDEKGKEKDATSRWLYTHIFSHFLTYSAEVLAIVVLLLFISAIFVTSKAFICPDFATEAKKTPWYCDRAQIRQLLIDEKPGPEVLFPTR